ncbi:citryl-CoA lyase [Salinicola lusitanus]|uniref:citryl-CoA lyase n=1 Tax=Salinicola lusitanus TaxID=1949085 RepID=UPI000DA14E6B|nr:citryl-CoA lyase [Salinicola lusitanus]
MSASQTPEYQAQQWWKTDIIDMRPGEIRYRGYPIEELIGNVGFADMVWLMTRGELPSRAQAALLETALMSAVDHGPQAPSIAIARMAMTCGGSLNNAMASAVNVLDDVHGGAGEQAVELYQSILEYQIGGHPLEIAVEEGIATWQRERTRIIPGFGHRFHPVDPRGPRLLQLVEEAAERGEVDGNFVAIAREVERQLIAMKGKPIPLNIDGATAVIYAELGFPAPLARGLFCLSRSVGILAHAWEQQCQGGRNKGPMPKGWLWPYGGPAPRPVPGRDRP